MRTPKFYKEILKSLGFSSLFKINNHGLESITTGHIYSPDDIKVLNSYPLETGAGNQMICIYTIETKNGERGILIEEDIKKPNKVLNTFINSIENEK